MLVSDFISASMKKLGLLAAGETASASELTDGLSTFQNMLRSWAADDINLMSLTKESFSLVIATAMYTWGSGGVFTTTRPNEVIGAYIVDSTNVSRPLDIITEKEFREIEIKAATGRPTKLWYNPVYPLGNAYMFPVPAAVETIWIDSYKSLVETSSFDVVGSTVAVPTTYNEALIYGLAIRMAPDFGKTVPPEVMDIAKTSYGRLVKLHTSQRQSGKNLTEAEVAQLRKLLGGGNTQPTVGV